MQPLYLLPKQASTPIPGFADHRPPVGTIVHVVAKNHWRREPIDFCHPGVVLKRRTKWIDIVAWWHHGGPELTATVHVGVVHHPDPTCAEAISWHHIWECPWAVDGEVNADE